MSKFIFLSLFLCTSVLAQEEWTKNFSIDWYNRYIYRDVRSNSFVNPDNNFALIPQRTVETDFRGTLAFEKGSHLLKINPRVIAFQTEVDHEKSEDSLLKADPFFNELFYQLTTDNHQIALGFQNYQWGPAEMLSPTNPIFRFLQDQRSLFFQQRGRNLLRWNWTIDKSWSLITMIELTENDVPLPREKQKFSQNGLMKLEKSFDVSSNYIGGVAGVTPLQEEFIGEYGNWGISDEVSVYFDVRHQYETNNFYPRPKGIFLQKNRDSQKVYTLGTVGMRYEGRVDVRLEYIYNGVGLSSKEWKAAKQNLSTSSFDLPENVKRFYFSGRDLQKKHYGYASVRIPDLGKKDLYTVFFRYFKNLEDASAVSQFLIDRITGDHFNLYLEAATYQGHKNAEFSSLITSEVSAGFKWSY